MKHSFIKKSVLLIITSLLTCLAFAQDYNPIPEFSFKNAKLMSGIHNKDGAIYKFYNIAPGYDATVEVLSRSSSAVVLDTIDLYGAGPNMGFDKAFQPQFGIKGNVPSNQNWWMKFKITFLNSSNGKPANIDKFTATALDVDGDNASITEYVTMEKAIAAKFGSPSVLLQSKINAAICSHDNKSSLPVICNNCLGLGYSLAVGKMKQCGKCLGIGYVFTACNHPWEGEDITVKATTLNQTGVDTSASQNMVMFTYGNVNSFILTYGATSGSVISNAGVRLNSIWFKAFNLSAPSTTLPVTLSSFTAINNNSNILLNWNVAMQENFSHFNIQRSTDGSNFTTIATIFSKTANEPDNYQFTDKNVGSATGVVMYRLEMVDINTEREYSMVRSIHLNNQPSAALSLITYPNPVINQVNITLPFAWQGKPVDLELYNSNGTVIKSQHIGAASQTEQIMMNTLPKGFYLVSISQNSQTARQSIIKN